MEMCDTAISNLNSSWTSFTPSWTNLTVGSATNQGYYKQIGKTVFFRTNLTLAADSSVGTGPRITNLPGTTALTNITPIGNALLRDATASYFDGHVVSSGIIQGKVISGTTIIWQNITATTPFTWTTSDEINTIGFYEVQ